MTSPEKLATPEINHASAETAKVVEQAIGALADILGGWRYIRQSHGDLYGVGWDRCEKSASIAIAALRTEVSRLATGRQDAGGAASGGQGEPESWETAGFDERGRDLLERSIARMPVKLWDEWHDYVRFKNLGGADRSSIQGAPTPPADVDLPDRVIDQLMHDAGVSLMEPWSEQEMYDFANTVKREVLARLPSMVAAPPPPHPDHTGGEAVAPEAKPTLTGPISIGHSDADGWYLKAPYATPEDARQAINLLRAPPPAPPAPLPGKDEVEQMRARKDAAYLERNQVVAALAKCFPSGIAKTAIEGWSEDWHGCVYIDLPTGQASWHFHDSHAYLFDGLPPYTGTWDGHDTPEKYRRLAALSAQAAPADYPPLPTNADLGFLADDIREEPVTWSLICDLVRKAIAADRTQRSGVSADPLPLTDTYVQPVPDKCDRITWRGQYYHLPVSSQSQPLVKPTADRKSLNAMAADLLRPYLKEGQKVIWREAFRWQDDNGVLSNHYDGMELEQLADDFGYDWRYDMNFKHAAIVWNKVAASPQHQVKKGEPS